MPAKQVSTHIERWEAITPFRITGRVWDAFDSVVVEISEAGHCGRGEALGIFYLGESVSTMTAQIESVVDEIRAGANRQQLQRLLPPGGARNAIDCALWDLEAKSTGRRVWQLAGIEPRPIVTAYTIGLEDTPEQMAEKAAAAMAHQFLKIKLNADRPLERLRAIRDRRPDAQIVVDANQGWTFELLAALAPAFADLGVRMIEQPLARGADAELEGFISPVPLCADESCLHLGELPQAATRYQVINIKLDKAGGLTHALELAGAVRARGLGLMVGNMCGSSLAVAPAAVLGFLCDFVDVDGPLMQKWDRIPGLSYSAGRVAAFGPDVWG